MTAPRVLLPEHRHRIPAEREQRVRLRTAARRYAADHELLPPQSMPELETHAGALLTQLGLSPDFLSFAMVLLGNEVWQETLAAIPFERRLLLLPQCLRDPAACRAEADGFGMLCASCGRCVIAGIEKEAEDLGYVVLVAEGTTLVTRLLERGAVDAVVGVSCLDALERSFPYLAAEAIPGLAVPLLAGGCRATQVDLDWVLETLRMRSGTVWRGMPDFGTQRSLVASWFTPRALRDLLAPRGTHAGELAIEWLAGDGKRWRPLLTVLCAEALTTEASPFSPQTLQRVAVAVECFHKASLVHDDIEDDDDYRYGKETLHRRYGTPIALNVGDLLLGEGYRLLAESGAGDAAIARMLAIAARGHHTLCLGQGEELAALREPLPLSPDKVLEIFRLKTSPAFEVALRLGAVCAGSDHEAGAMLSAFSEALGIAYQVRDDMEDGWQQPANAGNRHNAVSPSLLMALACEQASNEERQRLLSAWRDGTPVAVPAEAMAKARQWLEHYKHAAIRALNASRNIHLRGLLTRLAARILNGREG